MATQRTLKLDREEDDYGDFYVAFVIDPSRPNDFETFGSRDAANAERLARMYAKQANLQITKVTRTKNMPEVSGSVMGLTRKGALIAASAGAGLGVLGSAGYLAAIEQRAFDRGFLDAQQGRPYAPAMMSGMGAEGLLPDWLTYLGIGMGTSAMAATLSQLAQTPWAAKRIRDAYSRGYEQGESSSVSGPYFDNCWWPRWRRTLEAANPGLKLPAKISGDGPRPAPAPAPAPTRGTADKAIEKVGDTLLRRLGGGFLIIPESVLKSFRHETTLAGDDLREVGTTGGYQPRRRRGADL